MSSSAGQCKGNPAHGKTRERERERESEMGEDYKTDTEIQHAVDFWLSVKLASSLRSCLALRAASRLEGAQVWL